MRAKWRQLGGDRELLVAECAYEQWHRLLFARFLAENSLLLHPQYKAPVTLADCEELAGELGEPDAWSVAARFAAEILPGIFRLDDPCVRLRLAPEGRYALEQILDGLPAEMFAADDALGWVYQFWQKDKKDEVNASERKIGGADLGPVTQLFTENYMVRFLLENSLGAWWAARHPDSPLVEGLRLSALRRRRSPSCRIVRRLARPRRRGDGHGPVLRLRALPRRGVLDALADARRGGRPRAGRRPGRGAARQPLRPRARPALRPDRDVRRGASGVEGRRRLAPAARPEHRLLRHPRQGTRRGVEALAHGDQRLENALARLHVLFRDADTLGSLIDPRRATEISDPTGASASLDDVDWDDVAPLLASGMSPRGAVIQPPPFSALTRRHRARSRASLTAIHLVTTNVPYLGAARHGPVSSAMSNGVYPRSSWDLRRSFLARALSSLRLVARCGRDSPAMAHTDVIPRLSPSHRLKNAPLAIARLGPGAFEHYLRRGRSTDPRSCDRRASAVSISSSVSMSRRRRVLPRKAAASATSRSSAV